MKNFEIIKIKILNRVFNLNNLLNIGDYDFRDYVIDKIIVIHQMFVVFFTS